MSAETFEYADDAAVFLANAASLPNDPDPWTDADLQEDGGNGERQPWSAKAIDMAYQKAVGLMTEQGASNEQWKQLNAAKDKLNWAAKEQRRMSWGWGLL
jgi:hypothetical protein